MFLERDGAPYSSQESASRRTEDVQKKAKSDSRRLSYVRPCLWVLTERKLKSVVGPTPTGERFNLGVHVGSLALHLL
jgi:hypothetical protein